MLESAKTQELLFSANSFVKANKSSITKRMDWTSRPFVVDSLDKGEVRNASKPVCQNATDSSMRARQMIPCSALITSFRACCRARYDSAMHDQAIDGDDDDDDSVG